MFGWMFSCPPRQNRDGSYTGFIKVQFKLARPVSLPPSRSTSSSSGWDGSCQEDKALKHRTSFYLPRDTVKHLHISSNTRAREVIEALLKKFTVVDNPAKFSLFERSERQNQGRETMCTWSWHLTYIDSYNKQYINCEQVIQFILSFFLVYLRKMSDDERPLFLRLCAGPNEKVLSLVLKENETGEVNVSKCPSDRESPSLCGHQRNYTNLNMQNHFKHIWGRSIHNIFGFFSQWDAFSFPELQNFLRILQREEEDYVRQIVRRYALARDKMKEAMKNFSTPGWNKLLFIPQKQKIRRRKRTKDARTQLITVWIQRVCGRTLCPTVIEDMRGL